MDSPLTNLTIVLFIAAVVVWVARSRPVVFRVDWRRQRARLTRGRLTSHVVSEIAETLSDAEIADGWIEGVRSRGRVQLKFSRHIPSGVRQQLRNVWEAQS